MHSNRVKPKEHLNSYHCLILLVGLRIGGGCYFNWRLQRVVIISCTYKLSARYIGISTEVGGDLYMSPSQSSYTKCKIPFWGFIHKKKMMIEISNLGHLIKYFQRAI